MLMAPGVCKIRRRCNVLQVPIQNYTSGGTKAGEPSPSGEDQNCGSIDLVNSPRMFRNRYRLLRFTIENSVLKMTFKVPLFRAQRHIKESRCISGNE